MLNMDIEMQPSLPDQDMWGGFCAFIKNYCCNELKENSTNNFCDRDHDHQELTPHSIFLTIGGQPATQLLHENGFSEDDIFQFDSILSKVEEQCLLKFILNYEMYKEDIRKSQRVDIDDCDRQEVSHQNLLFQKNDVFPLKDLHPFKSFVVVSGTSGSSTELKNQQSSHSDPKDKRLNPEDCITSSKDCSAHLTCDSIEFTPLSLNSTNIERDKSKEDFHTCKEKDADLRPVRRSSRQIRVSSKYADNKDTIQNLLKPGVEAVRNQKMTSSTSELPCVCSVCNKSFPDSISLINHCRKCHSHRQIKMGKPNLAFVCQCCKTKYPTSVELEEHYKHHESKKNGEHKKPNAPEEQARPLNSDQHTDTKVIDTLMQSGGNKKQKLQTSPFESDKASNSDKSNQAYSCTDDFQKDKYVNVKNKKDEETSKCHRNSKSLENRTRLSSHEETLSKEKSKHGFPTKVKKFDNNKAGKRLYRRSGAYKCSHCAKTFKYERQLDFHMTLHTGQKPHICEICGHAFRLRRSLFNHRRIHDESFLIKCEFCQKVFVDGKAFEAHKLVHTGVKPYSCETCGKGFRRFTGLRNHQRLHKKDEAIKCDECDKTFVDKWGMLKHKSIHSGEKPFVCGICGKMFRLNKGLQDHVKLHDKATQLQCTLCPRTFIEKRKLDAHMMTHKGEKPFICDKCGKGFMNAMNLRIHDRCHTGVRPYKCSFCDKTFNQQGPLIAHERHHKGERPYVCDVCGDGYITKSQLTIHKRKHTNERPYKCDQCDYAAYTGSLLKIHKVKHSDAKPFKCEICPSAFKRQHHLEVHSKTHLTNMMKETTEIIDIVIHKCPYCNECFGSEDGLTSHIDTHEIVVVTETVASANDDIFIDPSCPDEVAYNIVLL